MASTFDSHLRITLISAASTLFAVAAGCASNGAQDAATQPSAELKIAAVPGTSSKDPTTMPTGALASADNPRDLATAQPDTAVGSARDLFGGGNEPAGGGGGALTNQGIADLLQQLGVQFTAVPGGFVVHIRTTTPDGVQWTFPIVIALAQDGSVVWTSAGISRIGATGIPSPQVLVNLLAVNYQIAVVKFDVDPGGLLWLQHAFPNSGITAPALAAHVKFLIATLRTVEPLFRPLVPAGGGGPAPF